jgi:hypothetical protein
MGRSRWGQVGAVFEKFPTTAFQNRLGSILKSIVKKPCFLLPLPTPCVITPDRPPTTKSEVFAPTCHPLMYVPECRCEGTVRGLRQVVARS